MKPSSLVLAAIASIAAASASAAEPPAAPGTAARASLAWQAPPECIDAASLSASIERQLARPVFTERAGADLSVRGAVLREPRGWRVELRLADGAGAPLGERTLVSEAADCRALDESLALVLALMLDVAAERALPARGPPPAPARGPPPAPARRGPLRVALGPARPAPAGTMQLALGGAASVGLLPGAAWAAQLSLALDAPGLPMLEAQAAYWPAAETREREGGARLRLIEAALGVCPLGRAADAVWLHLCASARAGSLSAEGFGWSEDRSSERLLLTAGVRARLGLFFAGPWVLRAALGPDFPLLRDRFFVRAEDGSEHDLFRSGPVAASGELGVGVGVP